MVTSGADFRCEGLTGQLAPAYLILVTDYAGVQWRLAEVVTVSMKLLPSHSHAEKKIVAQPVGGDTCQAPRPKGKLARPKPCYQWTTADVQKWFKRHCSDYFQQYGQLFASNDITGKALVRISEATLYRMGIKEPEHVDAILREILKLRLKADIQEMREIEMSAEGRGDEAREDMRAGRR
ncbi:Protein aveugle [Chionoecetes opilio]|uniref:Protein aveugle n=1 Tax=Chionoecetes opilio TaxID=41210 RepID=A0A8J4Y6B2_CHIOP|nr:Protein aveugle [Chionoecetes opilio]